MIRSDESVAVASVRERGGRTEARDGAGLDGALPPNLRRRFERGLGADLGQVRIHADAAAAEQARALQARAFTVGSDIYFGADAYRPDEAEGVRLLAHEVVHAAQQAGARRRDQTGGGPGAPMPGAVPRQIQRKMEVVDPTLAPPGAPAGTTNESVIDGYVQQLCPDFHATGGVVEPGPTGCVAPGASATPASCSCLCSLHALADTWHIRVDDTAWPHTDPGAKSVTVFSPFNALGVGSWTGGPNEQRHLSDNWLALGHELCGHAEPIAGGRHPRQRERHGGRPSHDFTVAIENQIAQEHGTPAAEVRGMFANRHHGESFGTLTINGFPSRSADLSGLPAASLARLQAAAAFATAAGPGDPERLIDVIGHTDQPTSTTEGNRSMARARARAVRDEMIRQGVRWRQFRTVAGVDPSDCPQPGDEPSCRKVEIFIFLFEGASARHR